MYVCGGGGEAHPLSGRHTHCSLMAGALSGEVHQLTPLKLVLSHVSLNDVKNNNGNGGCLFFFAFFFLPSAVRQALW